MKNLRLISVASEKDAGYLYKSVFYIAENTLHPFEPEAGEMGLYLLLTDYKSNNIEKLAELCERVWNISLNKEILYRNMGLNYQLYLLMIEYGEIVLARYIDLADGDEINKILHYIYCYCGRDLGELPY